MTGDVETTMPGRPAHPGDRLSCSALYLESVPMSSSVVDGWARINGSEAADMQVGRLHKVIQGKMR